jgi:hypothetical protein
LKAQKFDRRAALEDLVNGLIRINCSENGFRYTGRCVCGQELEPAYSPELGVTFMNCFRCFPQHKRLNKL